MGQNESRSTTTTTAVTPVVTPSKSRFLAVVHHPPSSEMSNDLNNKTCNTTTKFLGMYANLIIFFIRNFHYFHRLFTGLFTFFIGRLAMEVVEVHLQSGSI